MNRDEIIEKFETEVENSGNNMTYRRIWNRMLPMIEQLPEEKLAGLENKTISEAINEMRKSVEEEAKNIHKNSGQGTVAMTISDEDGYKIMDKYFGLEAVEAAPKNTNANRRRRTVSLFEL